MPRLAALVSTTRTRAPDRRRLRDVRFVHLPVTHETKPFQEAALLDLVEETRRARCPARYMQVPDDLTRKLGRAINIHHLFLPHSKAQSGLQAYQARRETDWCDQPLRHRRPRRGPDHRAGRRSASTTPTPLRISSRSVATPSLGSSPVPSGSTWSAAACSACTP